MNTKLSLMLTALLGVLPLLSAAATPALENPERDAYLHQLQQQHGQTNNRAALVAHINSLLEQHALLRGYQLNQADAEDIRFSIEAPGKGQLVIREQRNSADGRLSVSHQRLEFFGMDPFFSVQCGNRQIDCLIQHASWQAPLLRIVRQPAAADELAQALSYLVRDLQRN